MADVNTDMFLPLYPLKVLTCFGLDESTADDDVQVVARPMGIEVQVDPAPQRNAFIRSDQYNSFAAGFRPSWSPSAITTARPRKLW